jgi:hypothetical protein
MSDSPEAALVGQNRLPSEGLDTVPAVVLGGV